MKMDWDTFSKTPMLDSIESDEIENGKLYRVRNRGYRLFLALEVEIDPDPDKPIGK